VRPHVVAFVFARGGSKGVPRKNLRELRGRPLVTWAIDAARSSRSVDRVVVSTDDLEIAEVARRAGADVPFLRPAALAGDASPEWLAWQHALRELEALGSQPPIDVFLSVSPTAPLRSPEDLDACVDLLLAGAAQDPPTDVVITVTPAQRNPYFNMVELGAAGLASLVCRPDSAVSRRQEAPIVYDMTTVAYAARPAYVRRACGVFAGAVRALVVPEERAIDIDTERDLRVAEMLLAEAELRPT
jgi:N,N'-diacetyl-8-epilegionaminate cytidylyltransferase